MGDYKYFPFLLLFHTLHWSISVLLSSILWLILEKSQSFGGLYTIFYRLFRFIISINTKLCFNIICDKTNCLYRCILFNIALTNIVVFSQLLYYGMFVCIIFSLLGIFAKVLATSTLIEKRPTLSTPK